MDSENPIMKLPRQIEATLTEIPWTRSVAAGSLIVGALLLISGKRRSGLAVAAAGATVALLENPQAVRDAWESVPRLVRSGQNFLVRVEDFVDELNKQGVRLGKVVANATNR
jgi:hypothetical protein